MKNEHAIHQMIAIVVSEAAERAEPIDVNAVAVRVSSAYPQSEIGIEEICARIERVLAKAVAAEAARPLEFQPATLSSRHGSAKREQLN